MKVLVTGGAGFIGSHLVDALVARGDEVVSVDNLSGCYGRPLTMKPDIDTVGDIRSETWWWGTHGPHDALIHLAAKPGVRASIDDPLGTYDVNVKGTLLVLKHAAQAGIRKVIFASSSSVYGGATTWPSKESDPLTPISPYAASKLAGEHLCQVYAHLHGLQVTALRFFTVYGPRQRPDLAIHRFAKAVLSGQPVTLYGNGTTKRDYTYITDIVQGILAALSYEAPGFEVFNMGSGQPVSLQRMLETVEMALDRKAEIERAEERPCDARITHASIEKTRARLGWAPKVTFDDGVRNFVAWLTASSVQETATV